MLICGLWARKRRKRKCRRCGRRLKRRKNRLSSWLLRHGGE